MRILDGRTEGQVFDALFLLTEDEFSAFITFMQDAAPLDPSSDTHSHIFGIHTRSVSPDGGMPQIQANVYGVDEASQRTWSGQPLLLLNDTHGVLDTFI